MNILDRTAPQAPSQQYLFIGHLSIFSMKISIVQKRKTPFPVFTGKGGSYHGGAGRDRTDDLLNAIQALSQLSYSPIQYA